MMEKSIPLSIAIENTKAMVFDALNQIREKTNLPAYLMEGIILDILSEIRNQKNVELIVDLNRMKETSNTDGGDE